MNWLVIEYDLHGNNVKDKKFRYYDNAREYVKENEANLPKGHWFYIADIGY